MKLNKNIESNIGFLGIILALSPFTDTLKTIVICQIYTLKITTYHLYFIYAFLFTTFVILQSYYNAFISRISNSNSRLKYLKFLNFSYFIALTFVPVFLLGIIFLKYSIEKKSTIIYSAQPYFIGLFVSFIILVFYKEYISKYKNFEVEQNIKNELHNKLEISNQFLQQNEYEKLAILHYNISKKYLSLLTKKSVENIDRSSITDFIVDAYNKSLISLSQKTKFEKIASNWDIANLNKAVNEKTILDINDLFESHSFLKEEIDNFCS